MVGPISVLNSRELTATVLAIHSAPKEIRKNIRQYTKSEIVLPWTSEITKRAGRSPRPHEAVRAIAATSRVQVSDRAVRVTAGASKRAVLSGGLIPFQDARKIEFGSMGQKVTTYNRKGHKVTRHTDRQLRPLTRKGSVFYPAAGEMQPRLLALWVQTTVRTILDALDGKGG